MKHAIGKKVAKKIANMLFRIFGGAPLYAWSGHFYSPIVDPAEARETVSSPDVMANHPRLPHIDSDKIRSNLDLFSRHFPKIQSFLGVTDSLRYRVSDQYFNAGDAYILSALICELRPKRYIEVGSGYSSACAMDTSDVLGIDTNFTFVDPYPDRLNSILLKKDRSRCKILPIPIQRVDTFIFNSLQANDILFLDTTHICKTGSDFNFELFEILPRLNSGVVIHFHDIFSDWEYPHDWIYEDNRSWNEIYALRAFLMYNDSFEIIYFNDFAWKHLSDHVMKTQLSRLGDPGSGIYIRKK